MLAQLPVRRKGDSRSCWSATHSGGAAAPSGGTVRLVYILGETPSGGCTRLSDRPAAQCSPKPMFLHDPAGFLRRHREAGDSSSAAARPLIDVVEHFSGADRAEPGRDGPYAPFR